MKFLKCVFLALLCFSLTIFLLTRTDNGKVIFYRTMREIFHIETEVVPLYWGLADQIGWYGYGEWVHEKYHIPVKYAYGYPRKDFDGRFKRTFQLKDAFPSIDLRSTPADLKSGCMPRSFAIAMPPCAMKTAFGF